MTPDQLAGPDRFVEMVDGRRVALDDVGDPDGTPVLYFHGTPDSRLARHPDDSLARDNGIRLIAFDRPGMGSSDPDPAATPASVAADAAAVLDELGIASCGVLSWSAGSIFALALAGVHPDRVEDVVLVSPLVPADAYGDEHVLDGADDSRQMFAEVCRDLPADEVGRELAMWLVPPEIDADTARAMLETSLAAVSTIPGAGDQLVASIRASVAQGIAGIEREITAQAIPLGNLLDRIEAAVTIHVGNDDVVTPPAMAAWLGHRLGRVPVVHGGHGHALAITSWADRIVEAGGGW